MRHLLLTLVLLVMLGQSTYCQLAYNYKSTDSTGLDRSQILRAIAKDYLSNVALYDGKSLGPVVSDSATASVLNEYAEFIRLISEQFSGAYEHADSSTKSLEERIVQLKRLADPISREVELLYYQKLASNGNKELRIDTDSIAAIIRRKIVASTHIAEQ